MPVFTYVEVPKNKQKDLAEELFDIKTIDFKPKTKSKTPAKPVPTDTFIGITKNALGEFNVVELLIENTMKDNQAIVRARVFQKDQSNSTPDIFNWLGRQIFTELTK